MASVALARGINANLLRRWVREAEMPTPKAPPKPVSAAPAFLPVRLPETPAATGDIRIEVRRGATMIIVAWPMSAAAECATWMRDLLA